MPYVFDCPSCLVLCAGSFPCILFSPISMHHCRRVCMFEFFVFFYTLRYRPLFNSASFILVGAVRCGYNNNSIRKLNMHNPRIYFSIYWAEHKSESRSMVQAYAIYFSQSLPLASNYRLSNYIFFPRRFCRCRLLFFVHLIPFIIVCTSIPNRISLLQR